MRTFIVTEVGKNGYAHETTLSGFHGEQLAYNLYDRLAGERRVFYVGLFEIQLDRQNKPTVLIKQVMRNPEPEDAPK